MSEQHSLPAPHGHAIEDKLKPSFVTPRFPMGTPEWAAHVFATPPVRNLKGHSKHTQHHRSLSELEKKILGVQGGKENKSLYVAEYLGQIGVIARLKPQPFETNKQEFGLEIVPDFLVQVSGTKELIVIETKSEKFLTRDKHRRLDEVREKFRGFGIKYVVWTGTRPLTREVRYHITNMRFANNQRIGERLREDEIERAVAWIKTTPNPTYGSFFRADFDSDYLFAAAWRGEAYFPLTKVLEASTPLGLRPFENLMSLFLDCENRVDEWWHELADF